MTTLPHILAEASVDPDWSHNMGLWLVMIVPTVASLVSIWAAFWGKSKTEIQQPLVVEMAKEFVLLKTHEDFADEVRTNLREVDARLTKVDADRRDSVNRCYKNTERLVSEMRAEIKQDQQDLSIQLRDNNDGLNARINDILAALSRLSGAFEQSQRK